MHLFFEKTNITHLFCVNPEMKKNGVKHLKIEIGRFVRMMAMPIYIFIFSLGFTGFTGFTIDGKWL